ncbi:hypothetical protein K3495_g6727 [Podosphaera aphanis]|nr:hypothetical protein K3495_g6727 [Podosphaera aphanis]
MAKKTDLSRQERKAKRRATEDQIPDVPRGLEPDPVDEESRSSPPAQVPGKKRKRDAATETSVAGQRSKAQPATTTTPGDPVAKAGTSMPSPKNPTPRDVEPPPKKRKKERKAESRAAKLADAARAVDQIDGESVVTQGTGAGESSKPKNNRNREKKRKAAAAAAAQALQSKPARFIVFVGNLPFTATTASITKHFAKLKPVSVRNLTQKNDPQKSRGMAFVEFENYDTHKTALKVMHHSSFDDGISEPRKINVELTVGGGGNKDGRQAKIKTKNERLDEQRQRRAQEEAKEKAKSKSDGNRREVNTAKTEKNAIHPSRQNLVSV